MLQADIFLRMCYNCGYFINKVITFRASSKKITRITQGKKAKVWVLWTHDVRRRLSVHILVRVCVCARARVCVCVRAHAFVCVGGVHVNVNAWKEEKKRKVQPVCHEAVETNDSMKLMVIYLQQRRNVANLLLLTQVCRQHGAPKARKILVVNIVFWSSNKRHITCQKEIPASIPSCLSHTSKYFLLQNKNKKQTNKKSRRTAGC